MHVRILMCLSLFVFVHSLMPHNTIINCYTPFFVVECDVYAILYDELITFEMKTFRYADEL